MKKTIIIVLVIVFVIAVLLYYQNSTGRDIIQEAKSVIIVKSPAFKNGEMMPAKYTCDSEDISPAIFWDQVPEETKSFVLIATDFDAPSENFPILTIVHWVVYNIPSNILSLPEGVTKNSEIENGAKQGKNTTGDFGYMGPCPPMGTHDYNFKVYALDTVLDLVPDEATKKSVLEAAKGHVLGMGELIGKYKSQ